MSDLAARVRANMRTSLRMADPHGLHRWLYYNSGSNPVLQSSLMTSLRMADPHGLDDLDPSYGPNQALMVQNPTTTSEVSFDVILDFLRERMGAKRYFKLIDYAANDPTRVVTDVRALLGDLDEDMGEILHHASVAEAALKDIEKSSSAFRADCDRWEAERIRPTALVKYQKL